MLQLYLKPQFPDITKTSVVEIKRHNSVRKAILCMQCLLFVIWSLATMFANSLNFSILLLSLSLCYIITFTASSTPAGVSNCRHVDLATSTSI